MTRMTKTEQIARDGLMKNLIHLHRDSWLTSSLRDEIPDAWHTLEADIEACEPKQKISLYLDRSVVKFYRAMGHGYQARINRLLATWAQMQIAKEVKLDEYLAKRVGMPEEEGEASGPQVDPEYAASMRRKGKMRGA